MSSSPNRYVDIIGTKPTMLLPCLPRGPNEEEKSRLREFASKYPQFFCELGSGSGGHLIELAKRYPSVGCLGFELRFKRAFRTVEKAEEHGISNLLLAKTDAKFLLELYGANSIDRVYVNFPDPWEKKKWLKHRLLSPLMLAGIADRLKPGGTLIYKTDHLEYLRATAALLATVPVLKQVLYSENYSSENLEVERIPTEFEKLFISQGKPIGYLRAVKS